MRHLEHPSVRLTAVLSAIVLVMTTIQVWVVALGGLDPASARSLTLRLVLALACLAVGGFSLAAPSEDSRSRLLAAIFFLIAWEFSLPEGVDPGSWLSPVVELSFYVCTGLGMALELHLASVIPRTAGWLRRRPWVIAIYYVVGSTFALAGMLGWIAEARGLRFLPWSVDTFDDWMHWVVFPVWALGLVVLLAVAVSRAHEREERLQALAVLLGVLPWALYIGIEWSLGYPDRDGTSLLTDLFPLLVLCYPLSVFVAIFRFHLFDLELVLRRSLAYTALTSALVVVFYAALGAGSALFSRFVSGAAVSVWALSIATLLLGLLFSPLRRAVLRFIDRRFFPEREVLRKRLIGLAAELPALGRLERMGEHLVRALCDGFHVESASLLVADPVSGVLVREAHVTRRGDELPHSLPDAENGDASPVPVAVMAEIDDPAIGWLCLAGQPLPVRELAGLSPVLANQLEPLRSRIAVPLRLEARLVGVLLLGAKSNGARFTAEETELLGLVAHHVAAVLDNVRLFQSATYEGLTGLLRREAVLACLEREVERAVRYARPLTVALADLDHFKAVNDHFGHLEGDRVLRRVAEELSGRLRASDAIGRYGGEEFLLVFPETELEVAEGLAEELRRSIEGIRLRSGSGASIEPRISIGVASLDEAGRTDPDVVRRLIEAADRQLYRAKQGGRNRVEPRTALAS